MNHEAIKKSINELLDAGVMVHLEFSGCSRGEKTKIESSKWCVSLYLNESDKENWAEFIAKAYAKLDELKAELTYDSNSPNIMTSINASINLKKLLENK